FALFVRLGGDSVACQSFVPAQCRGLAASAVVHSPTNLVPLLDLDFHLEFRREESDESFGVPVRLSGSQLTARSAVVTLVPRRYPRKRGAWTVSWRAGEKVIAQQRIIGISKRQFLNSLRISDTRFVVQREGSPIRLERLAPELDGSTRIGPCFLVSSSE